MLHIYYGFGKGKTSNLNGMAIRALGANKKVLLIRFLKGVPSNEDKILKDLSGLKLVINFSQQKFIKFMDESEIATAKNDTQQSIDYLLSNAKDYDIILLDEIIDLVETKLLTEEKLLEVLTSIPKEKEVLISGHYKLEKIFNIADLITHFENEKHYFEKGIEARDGIEK